MLISLSPFRVLRLWWNEEDYRRTSKADKLVRMFCCVTFSTTFSSFFIYTYQSRDEQSLSVYLGNMSIFLLSLMTFYAVSLFHYKRAPFSQVIRDINEKSWNLRLRVDSFKMRSRRNRIHLLCIYIFSLGMILSFLAGLSLVIEFLATGEDHLKNHFTAHKPPYSIWPFVNSILGCFLFLWALFFLIPIYTIIIEIYLIIALNYRVLADDLRVIEIGMDENRIFKGLMKDIQDLQWSVYILINDIFHPLFVL